MTFLDDLLVVELASALAGPQAGMMLADMGARVIKVEPPAGDVSRGWGPPFVGSGEGRVSTYFLSCNRSKESVVLDIARQRDVATLQALVDRADVLVHNWPAARLERAGLDYPGLTERNPGLVVLEISGFGPDGPDAARLGYDQVAQAESGLMSVTGHPGRPTRVGVPVTDVAAGMYGAFGVLAALHARTRTGEGTVVHASLLAAGVGLHAFQGTRVTVAGERPGPVGDHHPTIAPYGLFQAADGPLVLAVGTDAQWRALAAVLGLDPAEEFASNAGRVAHRARLQEQIDQVLATEPAGDWVRRLTEVSVPAGEVRELDAVYATGQAGAQGLVRTVVGRDGALQVPGPVLRAHGLGDSEDRGLLPVAAAPALGQHTEAVRAWLEAEAGG